MEGGSYSYVWGGCGIVGGGASCVAGGRDVITAVGNMPEERLEPNAFFLFFTQTWRILQPVMWP